MPDYHPFIFDDLVGIFLKFYLDGIVVREAALHTSGAAGPSGADEGSDIC